MTVMKTSDIQIRDPFVVPVHEESAYYLFGTTDRNCWDGEGFNCFRSRNLIDWEGPMQAFRPAPSFWGRDGGHGMIFRRFDGRLFVTFHTPNDTPNERPVFIEIEDAGSSVCIRDTKKTVK